MANEPAFPCKEMRNTSSDPLATPREFNHPGMSLRDYFAGLALGLFKYNLDSPLPSEERYQRGAQVAYGVADAMLAEREKSR